MAENNKKCIEVNSHISKEMQKEIEKICYEHGKETFKRESKMDVFVMICGIFALGCLGYSVYNVLHYGIDLIFGLMMAGYVLVAVFCLVKPLQYMLSRMSWRLGFNGRLVAGAQGSTVKLDEEAIQIVYRKQDKKLMFSKMWDAYETEGCFIFHYADNCIIPIAKISVSEAEKTNADKNLTQFLGELITKVREKAALGEQ